MNIVAWRYRPTIGVDKFQWRLTEVPPWKWGPDIAIVYGHECADRCADIALMMTLRTRYEAGDRYRP